MVQESYADRMLGILIYVMLSLVLFIVLYPLFFVVIASLSDPAMVLRGDVWLHPKGFNLVGYEKIIGNTDILKGYLNTILYALAGTAVNLVMTIISAYPLSRRVFFGKNLIMMMFVFTMFFSGGLIPSYLLIKNLGMMDTFWVMIIPNAVAIWNIIIMRTFFQSTIPNEVYEAAEIDGSSHVQSLIGIVLPLSMPVIAVMILFYSVAHWNAFFNALIYLSDRDKYPLQLILREILVQNQLSEMVGTADDTIAQNLLAGESIKYAVIIFANLPILILYPLLQKYFVKGVMIGAIKG